MVVESAIKGTWIWPQSISLCYTTWPTSLWYLIFLSKDVSSIAWRNKNNSLWSYAVSPLWCFPSSSLSSVPRQPFLCASILSLYPSWIFLEVPISLPPPSFNFYSVLYLHLLLMFFFSQADFAMNCLFPQRSWNVFSLSLLNLWVIVNGRI